MDEDEEVAELRIPSVRGLLMVLQAVKPAAKQVRPCSSSPDAKMVLISRPLSHYIDTPR